MDVGRDRTCPRVLSLVYPSRTRALLSDCKTANPLNIGSGRRLQRRRLTRANHAGLQAGPSDARTSRVWPPARQWLCLGKPSCGRCADTWLRVPAPCRGELVGEVALDLLPRRLALRVGVAACLHELRTPRLELLVGNDDVGGALAEIDAQPVARPHQSEAAAVSRLRRGVEDRRAARRSRLAPVADAGQLGDVPLEQIWLPGLGSGWGVMTGGALIGLALRTRSPRRVFPHGFPTGATSLDVDRRVPADKLSRFLGDLYHPLLGHV